MLRDEMEDKLEAIIKEARDSGMEWHDVVMTLDGMRDRYQEEMDAEDEAAPL